MPHYFATVARGLEALAARELETLGAAAVEPGFCGVAFQGNRALLYRVNLWARLPFRVLQVLATFPCRDADDLYRGVQAIDWTPHLPPDRVLAASATGKTDRLNHSHFTALQVKNAIADWQRDRFGERSDADPRNPDVRVTVHLARDRCTVHLDSSGTSLHRRGYRPAVGAAPLKETLAAAIVDLSGWQGDRAFYDPLCGSGTLPVEAGLKAANLAPGLFRVRAASPEENRAASPGENRFGFETWPDFDRPLWDRLREEARAARRDRPTVPIWGSDREAAAVDLAAANAARADLAESVWIFQQDLADAVAPADSGTLICNPPYGERLGEAAELGALYRQLGDVLKQRFKGWTAFVLSGNRELSKAIGLRASRRVPLFNGSLPCQLLEYELY